jgi:hypothetical protein
MKKEMKFEKAIGDRTLIIDNKLINKNTPKYFKDFNDYYTKFCDLTNQKDLSEIDNTKRLDYGEKAAIIVANYFDFERDEIKDKKNEYITFARDLFYENACKPNLDPDSMIFIIRALYGQTNIAYNQSSEHKIDNIKDGNDWVDELERNTDNHTAKAYGLTLRSYAYMVNAKELGISVKEILNKVENDLIYATKWDENNYIAYYALGLVYIDKANSKYDPNKAIDNFNKVLSFKDKATNLDYYLTETDKARIMSNASKKIDLMKQAL